VKGTTLALTLYLFCKAYYSDDANADRIKRVQNQIYEVRGIMQENIEKLLDRGERIELLVDKTENLAQSSLSFQKQSTSLKRAMWYKNIKILIIIGVLVVVRSSSVLFFEPFSV
jgi:vesicle-associated membrane protein 7